MILADSPDKLQAAINGMEKYCEKWKLKVNVSKTKIIIFGSRKHLVRVYLYNKKQIEIVDYFKYLGVPFTPNSKFTECRKYVVNQARKAMYLILKKARIQKLPIDVQLDLFHNMVLLILLYSSEVWGIENNDLIIELHVKFCKHILHCKTSTPTCMVYGELGEIPPSIEIKCIILKYWASMLTNPDKLSSRVYNVLLMLYNNNDYKSPWLKYVENTLNVNGLGFYWLTQAVDNIDSCMYIVKTRLTDQFKQEWYSDINTLRKCCSYRLCKTDFALEPYVLTLSYNHWITLCKFKVSDHKLAIELGRHLNIPKEERYCNLCQQGKIGNEYHFLLECNALVIIRKMSEMYHTNHSNWKFKKILNSYDEKELLKLSIFIKN